ncbi:MAG: matrixin family metalloprotease [Acidobacteria bacterium]|nr:matrixin family metalloprotease [Acidobacteriota bacterium]
MPLVYLDTSDEVMVDRSPLIVFGEVVSEAPGPRRGFPTTDLLFRVEEVLKGYAASSSITVRQPGGVSAGGRAGTIVGLPRPRVGDRMLLFLRPAEADDPGVETSVYAIVDHGLGMFFEVGGFGSAGGADRAVLMREASLHVVPEPVGAAAFDPRRPSRLPRAAPGFRNWIVDRAAGRERPADYFLPARPAVPASVVMPYRLLNVGEGCQRQFLPIRWLEFDRGEEVTLAVGTDSGGDSRAGANGVKAVKAAIRAWNRAPGSFIRFAVAETAKSDLPFARRDDASSVTFEDPLDEIPGDLETNSILAATFTFWDCESESLHRIPGGAGRRAYRIAEANLTTQDGMWEWLLSTDAPQRNYEEVLAHELGHALGIDHPCGTFGQCDRWSYEALMRGWVHEDGRGAALKTDDREAARDLYPAVSAPDGGPAASCVADESSLCLNRGRYRVSADWSTETSRGGAVAVGLTDDTGLFWFFDPANTELVVKVLDGCAINGHRWVYAAGLTDVQVRLMVDDTLSDRQWARENPWRTAFRPILDAAAFPCADDGPARGDG